MAGGAAGIVLLLFPEVQKSVTSLSGRISSFDAKGIAGFFSNVPFLQELALRYEEPINASLLKLSALLPAAFAKAAGKLLHFAVGLGLGVLIVFSKERLFRQFQQVIRYFGGDMKAQKTAAALSAAVQKFSRFLGAQALEAVIFRSACYIVLFLFKIPYAALLALILGAGNLIPMLGAYAAGGAGFLLVFSVSLPQAFIFLAVVVVLQQLEQFTTYPLVVGKSVGITAFWTLFSLTVGGALFGFWGVYLAVPAAAFGADFFQTLYGKKVKETETIPL
jgi:predicted PurR-regulated permease PerM